MRLFSENVNESEPSKDTDGNFSARSTQEIVAVNDCKKPFSMTSTET